MAANLVHLLAELQQQAAGYLPSDESIRQSLLQSARDLVSALETPVERLLNNIYVQPLIFAATRTLNDLDAFTILSNASGPLTVTQLAEKTGADPKILGRLLKHLAVEKYIQETAADEYTANELTRLLTTPAGQDSVKLMFRHLATYKAIPEHLQKIKYANPSDNHDAAFNLGWNTSKTLFEYSFAPGQEEYVQEFHNHMKLKALEKVWYDNSQLINAVFGDAEDSKDAVLLVDVGGNVGTDLVAFKKKHPSLPGRLISQDQQSVIDSLDASALSTQGVEAMGHDFYQPQPVQLAKAYCLKRVLHDWPLDQCRQILTNLRLALKPGYSRILINEIVIPDTGAKPMETATDLLMMALFATQERRQDEWRDLVQSVGGLKIRKFWDIPGALERVIEIELA